MFRSEKQAGSWVGSCNNFATTHWSVVILAQEKLTPEATVALEQLCRSYWYPLYAFVRREGRNPEEAADLTQEFFSHLLATNALEKVERGKGKFRSFLLASLKNLLANDWRHSRRQKRAGGYAHFSLDAATAEERYRLDPADELTAENHFDRRWAETLIDAVTHQLQEEFAQDGMAQRFEVLKVFLLADKRPDSYAETARRLAISEGAVRTAIYRMRQRYGELFRTELAQTVTGPRELEEEIRHFLAVMGS